MEHVGRFEKFVHDQFTENYPEYLNEIEETNDLSDELVDKMKEAMVSVQERYLRQHGLTVEDGE